MRGAGIAAVVAMASLAACQGVSHDRIDEWRETEKGPSKLKAALGNAELDPDLRAHAAQNLVQISEYAYVRTALEGMPDAQRGPIVGKLVPRLQADAQSPEGTAPSQRSVLAKDALVDLRPLVDVATRERIDAFLADWMGSNYIDRSGRGRYRGEQIVRLVGARIAPKLLAEARRLIAAAPDAQGRIPIVPDELLKALALSGDPEAVDLLLDLARKDHPEPTLRRRAMAALYVAYVGDPAEPKPSPAGIKPHVRTLAALVRDPDQPGANVNDAFAVLAAAGEPECVDPLLDLVRSPEKAEAFLWVAVHKALLCVGADGVAQVVEAMPTDRGYERGILEKYLWNKMLSLEPKAAVAEGCRAMLSSASWVARATGVECLGRAGSRADADAVAALAGDRTPLRGWAGGGAKGAISLGSVAQQVANKLKNM